MKQLSVTAFILLILGSAPLFSEELKWDIPLNGRMEIVRTASVRFLLNGKPTRDIEERNIIDLTCYKKSDKGSFVRGVFTVYEKASKDAVFQVRNQYPADFLIQPNGRYEVEAKYFVPNLRHIPTFPERDVKKVETWSSPAELILDNFSVPFKLIFPVRYVLAEIKTQDNHSVAVINFEYEIVKDLAGMKAPADFPLKIVGRSAGTLYWDIANKRLLNMQEKYRILFYFKTGVAEYGSSEFQMYIDTQNKFYAAVTPEEKQKAKNELKKELEKDGGIQVDTEKRGIVIRLGEILFDFDSARLRKDSKEKLENLTRILKEKYPDREIIVEGHTDTTGERRHNQKLSVNRARSVAEHLRERTDNGKLSYRGFGPDRPIADNSTKEGKKKNRRVEIIIKLH